MKPRQVFTAALENLEKYLGQTKPSKQEINQFVIAVFEQNVLDANEQQILVSKLLDKELIHANEVIFFQGIHWTLLSIAIYFQNEEIVKTLLEKGAKINSKTFDNTLDTLFFLSIFQASDKVFDTILECTLLEDLNIALNQMIRAQESKGLDHRAWHSFVINGQKSWIEKIWKRNNIKLDISTSNNTTIFDLFNFNKKQKLYLELNKELALLISQFEKSIRLLKKINYALLADIKNAQLNQCLSMQALLQGGNQQQKKILALLRARYSNEEKAPTKMTGSKKTFPTIKNIHSESKPQALPEDKSQAPNEQKLIEALEMYIKEKNNSWSRLLASNDRGKKINAAMSLIQCLNKQRPFNSLSVEDVAFLSKGKLSKIVDINALLETHKEQFAALLKNTQH